MAPSRVLGSAFLFLTFLLLSSGAALGLETAERTLSLEGRVPRGGTVAIDNLLGSVRIVPGTEAGVLRVEAHVVAEAKTPEEAASLAESIRLVDRTDAGTLRVHVVFPVDRVEAFRRPKAGVKGWITRWAGSVTRRNSEVEYDGKLVQVGSDRKATGLAVYLTVTLPYDVGSSVHQAVGPIEGRSLRGRIRLSTIDGDILAERCLGRVDVSSDVGAIRVLAFQGEELNVATGTGTMELLNVRATSTYLRTDAGTIRGSGLTAERLRIESKSGSIKLGAVEPRTAEVRTDSGKVDLATNFKTVREMSIRTMTGDVTLRVGPFAHFDLLAETKSGEVKTLGMSLELIEQNGQTSTLRQGQGGPNIRVSARDGSVILRPYDGSRLELLVGDR